MYGLFVASQSVVNIYWYYDNNDSDNNHSFDQICNVAIVQDEDVNDTESDNDNHDKNNSNNDDLFFLIASLLPWLNEFYSYERCQWYLYIQKMKV